MYALDGIFKITQQVLVILKICNDVHQMKTTSKAFLSNYRRNIKKTEESFMSEASFKVGFRSTGNIADCTCKQTSL
jgi:hypothetical protein